MPKSSRKKVISMRLVLLSALVLFVVFCVVTYFRQEKSIREAQNRLDELQNHLKELQLEAAALESDLEFSKTDAYIERVVRGELGYVKKGEIRFVEGTAEEGSESEASSKEATSQETEPAEEGSTQTDPDEGE